MIINLCDLFKNQKIACSFIWYKIYKIDKIDKVIFILIEFILKKIIIKNIHISK